MKQLQSLFVSLVAVALIALPTNSLAQNKSVVSYIDRGDIGTLDPNRMSWAQDIRVGQSL